MAETTVVQIRDVKRKNIDFIERLKRTFSGNVLCLERDNETKVHVILNLLESWTDSIKGMFCALSFDYFVKHRMMFRVFLILGSDILVCRQDKLYRLIQLLHKKITENTCITAFMRFDLDTKSFKTEMKNKNNNETNVSFASELYSQMLHCKTSSGTKNFISDKSMCITDSSKELIFFECESSRSHGNNKTCPSHKPENSPYPTDCLSEIPVDLSSKCTCRIIKPRRKIKSCPPRKSKDNQHYTTNNIHGNYNLPAVLGGPQESKNCQNHSYPVDRSDNLYPAVPLSPGSENTDHLACPEQCLSQIVEENDVRSDIQSRPLVDEPHSNDASNSNSGNNPVPMDFEVYAHSAIAGQPVSHDGTSRNILAFSVSQNDSRSQICISGSSFDRIEHSQFIGISLDNASASSTNYELPPPAGVQQSRPVHLGLLGGSTSAQPQQYQQQHRETTFTEPARIQAVRQQRNGNDDLLRALGRVRSPEYADLMDRLDTFSRWPSDIAQTPHQVAEAGFYYTGFQDIVRCFVCDGGLKNWDPDDNPWIEHARWFPECAFVRHVKGEEFINLVRMMTEEEDDPTVHTGATWERAETSNINADSALNVFTEPSVLEHEDAQIVIGMGFSNKDVAMAINDILKKDKQDFTSQEIADIILEKQLHGELIDSKLATDCLPSVRNTSTTEQVISENKHLKELLQCIECKTRQRNILFLPCTHHVVCESCSCDLHICTYCYRKIKEKVRTYMS